jgi:hypothetical protein
VGNSTAEDLKKRASERLKSAQAKIVCKGVTMKINTTDSIHSTPLLEQKPYQTPKLEVHEAYNALTAGIGLSIGMVQPFPSILDDSVSLDPQELGI